MRKRSLHRLIVIVCLTTGCARQAYVPGGVQCFLQGKAGVERRPAWMTDPFLLEAAKGSLAIDVKVGDSPELRQGRIRLLAPAGAILWTGNTRTSDSMPIAVTPPVDSGTLKLHLLVMFERTDSLFATYVRPGFRDTIVIRARRQECVVS